MPTQNGVGERACIVSLIPLQLLIQRACPSCWALFYQLQCSSSAARPAERQHGYEPRNPQSLDCQGRAHHAGSENWTILMLKMVDRICGNQLFSSHCRAQARFLESHAGSAYLTSIAVTDSLSRAFSPNPFHGLQGGRREVAGDRIDAERS
ncbi:hypothetical protein N658DRAFT_495876 [Parathielavia hyrcaniae]|uniref:Uncharacterized protein n=1 Tax=Parathielavia hyrcaniae TaxID=113614 RepID=A0AAN6T226_9PEZI|nr:hypothetical protein N658DRAFT_495876 [Parathielavia hyrcaniae]